MSAISEGIVQTGRYGTFRVRASARGRLRGLLGTGPDADPVVLVPCHAIHSFGMRYALDVAAVGEDGVVLAALRGMGPGRRWSVPGAVAVFERPATAGPWFEAGERLVCTADISRGQE